VGGGAAQQLVILLHGVGADGNDLIGLAPFYQRVVPRAAFVSPNAPFPFDMAPFGYQWFSIQDMQPNTRLLGVQTAAPIVNAFIDDQLNRAGLTEKELVLIGFSQGAMMALYVGLRRERALAGIISHSGILVGEQLLSSEIGSYPPVLLTHGAVDDVLPPKSLSEASAALSRAGVAAAAHLMPGLGHGIDEATIHLDLRFLTQVFEG
jgi:phospholipase/carboxylesterase